MEGDFICPTKTLSRFVTWRSVHQWWGINRLIPLRIVRNKPVFVLYLVPIIFTRPDGPFSEFCCSRVRLLDSQISASLESIPSFCERVHAEFFSQMAKDTQSRLIIFCRKVEWANAIAATLGTRLYTGPRALHDKQQDLAEWMRDDEQTVGQVSVYLSPPPHR